MSLDKQNIGSRLYQIPVRSQLGSRSLLNRIRTSLLQMIRFVYHDTGFVDIQDTPEFLDWQFTGTDGKFTVADLEDKGVEETFSYDDATGHVLQDTKIIRSKACES